MQSTVTTAGHLTAMAPRLIGTMCRLLMLVYTLNFIDRALIAVVAQPIIESFQLTDAVGSAVRAAFPIFYAIMGLPIALWADRSNRVHIISLCIVLWSIMTALCGVTGGLLLAPPLPNRRSHRRSGLHPTGKFLIGNISLLANALPRRGFIPWGSQVTYWQCSAAPLRKCRVLTWATGSRNRFRVAVDTDWANIEGWRIAFVVVGLPGVLVAMLVWAGIGTTRGADPPRKVQIPSPTDGDLRVGQSHRSGG